MIVALMAFVASGCSESTRSTEPASGWYEALPNTSIDEKTGLPREVRDRRYGLEFVLVPAGEFVMGADRDDHLASDNERPSRRVRITRPFYLARLEVLYGLYCAILGSRCPPGYESEPTQHVPLANARKFLNATGFRLPTEAEWEYACKLGSPTSEYRAKVLACVKKRQPPGVPKRPGPPNALGIRDMLGGVWEWCSDRYGPYPKLRPKAVDIDPTGPAEGKDYVVRGGCFSSPSEELRATVRWNMPPGLTPVFTVQPYGFRLARDP